jgi:hypothetical protein
MTSAALAWFVSTGHGQLRMVARAKEKPRQSIDLAGWGLRNRRMKTAGPAGSA